MVTIFTLKVEHLGDIVHQLWLVQASSKGWKLPSCKCVWNALNFVQYVCMYCMHKWVWWCRMSLQDGCVQGGAAHHSIPTKLDFTTTHTHTVRLNKQHLRIGSGWRSGWYMRWSEAQSLVLICSSNWLIVHVTTDVIYWTHNADMKTQKPVFELNNNLIYCIDESKCTEVVQKKVLHGLSWVMNKSRFQGPGGIQGFPGESLSLGIMLLRRE